MRGVCPSRAWLSLPQLSPLSFVACFVLFVRTRMLQFFAPCVSRSVAFRALCVLRSLLVTLLVKLLPVVPLGWAEWGPALSGVGRHAGVCA